MRIIENKREITIFRSFPLKIGRLEALSSTSDERTFVVESFFEKKRKKLYNRVDMQVFAKL